ncbi:hypothetical protein ACW9UR_00115 [Halovulum sp. GXIMD14794]
MGKGAKTPRTPKYPPMVVPPIHGVLPFDGARNPLGRSATSHKISETFVTPATNGRRKVYHFEGEAEYAVALEALLSPELHDLEVQLAPISYLAPNGKRRTHCFDLRLTFSDGHRRAVFVRNGRSLAKRETQDEIEAIFRQIPPSFADDAIVVNADDYTQAYRDNLRRFWYLHGKSDPVADAHVEAVARNAAFWFLKDLVSKCDLSPAAAWQSAMRLISRRVLGANWHAVISDHSRVWIPA